jgi:hypothetical protein
MGICFSLEMRGLQERFESLNKGRGAHRRARRLLMGYREVISDDRGCRKGRGIVVAEALQNKVLLRR